MDFLITIIIKKIVSCIKLTTVQNMMNILIIYYTYLHLHYIQFSMNVTIIRFLIKFKKFSMNAIIIRFLIKMKKKHKCIIHRNM